MSMLFNINMPKLAQKSMKSNQSKSQQRGDTAKSQSVVRNKDQITGHGQQLSQKKLFNPTNLNPVLKKKNTEQHQKPLKDLINKL